MDLSKMKTGEKALIKEVTGGHGLIQKMDAMGIRAGMEVTKVSAQWMRGPVVIRIGNTQVAVGYGMAKKILVETISDEKAAINR